MECVQNRLNRRYSADNLLITVDLIEIIGNVRLR